MAFAMNFQMSRRAVIVALAFCFAALSQSAFSQTVAQLMAQRDRPTIAQVSALSQADVDASLPPLDANFQNALANLMRFAPQIVASCERVFPGATWAFVGRDSAIYGDVLEGFYTSIGQPNRVVRVGMSRPTLNSASDALLVRYMEQLGLSLDPGAKPFVLVDTANYGNAGQPRRVLSAIYAEHFRRYGHVRNVVSRFNVIGMLTNGTSPYGSTLKGVEGDMASLQALYDNGVRDAGYNFANAHKVLSMDPPAPDYFLIGHDYKFDNWKVGVPTWHNSFGALVERNGHIEPTPGAVYDETYRKQHLRIQWELSKIVTSPAFQSNVVSEATTLGYQFPLTQPSAQNPERKTELDRKLDFLTEGERKLKGQADRGEKYQLQQMVRNAQYATTINSILALKIRDAMAMLSTSNSKELLSVLFLEVIEEAHLTRKITIQDVKGLMTELFTKAVLSESFFGRFYKYVRSNAEMNQVLIDISGLSGSGGINYGIIASLIDDRISDCRLNEMKYRSTTLN